MDDYYKAILARIDNAYLTGSCSITGLLMAKELYEELVLKGANNTEQPTSEERDSDRD